MSFYFTDQIQLSFNKIFHQCNKNIAWAGKAELDVLVKLDEEGQKIPGIGDVYAILARVYEGAQKGCSYCAYAIANVFQWGDYRLLPSAQKIVNEGEPAGVVHFLKSLFVQVDQRRLDAKITSIAQQWLHKSAAAGLVIAYRNLRLTYAEQDNRAMVFEGAAAGLPLMMYLAGNICKSRIAHLLQQPAIYTLDAIWPYLAYVFTFKKGNTPAIRTAIECVNKASKCYDRYGSYDYADHLWQLAAGYCYEIGAFTKEPDLDQAVTFYEHARESINRLNTRTDNWLGTGEPLVIPDEASERLAAFELIDGHYQYKEGIQQSSTTCNPMPPAWPQNSVDVLEIFEESATGWRTNKYDWEFIERGKGKNLRIQLYATVDEDNEYGFERESCNLTSINYWIQESITSNTLPDLSDWDEIKKK